MVQAGRARRQTGVITPEQYAAPGEAPAAGLSYRDCPSTSSLPRVKASCRKHSAASLGTLAECHPPAHRL